MNELVELAKLFGLPAAIAGSAWVGWLLYTRRLVTKRELEEEQARTRQMEEERDEWKDLCLRLLQGVEKAGHAAAQAGHVADQVIRTVVQQVVPKQPDDKQ